MEHIKQNKVFLDVVTEIMSGSFNQRDWRLLGGLDPTNRVWDIGDKIIKVSKIENFYAEMQIESLRDIHNTLGLMRVAPMLEEIIYKEPYIVAVYEKLECRGKPTASEIGESLAKAHQALENVPIRKSFPWVGFYGEPNEFRFLIPLVKDNIIRNKSEILLEKVTCRPHTKPVHYIHRDLNPDNVLKTDSGIYLIDWDMAHGGHREDDVAMSICCLASTIEDGEGIFSFGTEFLEGYRRHISVDWAYINSPIMVSAIALAGLRQSVSGWFSDKGDVSELYWPNIFKRLEVSIELCLQG